jgi:hypothetical protein
MEIIRDIFRNNKKALLEWMNKEPYILFIVPLFGIAYPLIILNFNIVLFLDNHIAYANDIVTIGIPVLFIIINIIFYFHWKINNYYLVTPKLDSTLVIKGKNDELSIPTKDHILLTEEETTLVTLDLEFPESMVEELKKKEVYTIIFDKNHSLEIKCKNKEYSLVDNGFKKDTYCIQFNYTNVSKKTHIFKFDSKKEKSADIKIFFIMGDCSSNYKDKIKKKNVLIKKSLYFDELKISNGNCIIIDKRSITEN